MLLGAAPASARGLTVALQLEPPILDPTGGAAAAIGEVTYRTIFEGLTTLDATGRAVPLLAIGWTMAPDAQSYVFHLRGGVRFQDGAPLDANAVAFSLRRAAAPASPDPQALALAEIAGVDTLGPLAVRIRLASPDAALPTLLARSGCVIVSPRAVAALATHPVGTGPFLLGTWSRGDRLTLLPWHGYWTARPAIDRLTFRFIADPAAAFAAVKSHAVDVFPDYPAPENLAQFRADPTLRVTTAPSEGKVILALNNAKGPFRDLRVRRAIAYALDRRQIIDGAMAAYGAPIGSHFPPQDPDYVDLTGRYPHDPARARALLAAAGYLHGFDTVLTLPPPSYARRGGEIVAAQLRAVGIRATVTPIEWPQWLEAVFGRHAYDMTIVNHAEPQDYDIYGRRGYYFGYDGADVRALLGRLGGATDPRLRHDLLGAIQRRITEDAVNGFLFEFPHLSVADARLTHLWANTPLQEIDYAAVRFDGGGVDAVTRPGGGVSAIWPWVLPGSALLALAAIARLIGPAALVRRVGVLLLTLLGASILIFLVTGLAPGDPARFMLGLDASPSSVMALRAELGLGGSGPHRYLAWAGGLLRGSLGTSYTYRVPVVVLLAPRLAVSLPLTALAMILSVALGLGGALLAAGRPGGRVDRAVGGIAELGLALPAFWLAVLLLLFAARLRWAAAIGFPGWKAGVGPPLAALALPAVALALPQASVIARVARGALGEELARDYVRAARAKGLGGRAILWGQVLPNVLAPILTIVGLQIPFLLAGSVMVETVFALPGLGQLTLQAISGRDLVTVQAVAMLLAAVAVVTSFLVDIGQMLADPRLRARE